MTDVVIQSIRTPTAYELVVLPGVRAIRALWKPFLLIQLAAFAVVVFYFTLDSVRAACEVLAEWKARGGYLFSIVAMSIAAGFVPEVVKYLSGVDRALDRKRLRDLRFNMALFAVMGFVGDSFYRFLAVLLGESDRVGIIVAKVVIDMFVYTPICGVVIIAIGYHIRRKRYRIGAILGSLGSRWYLEEVGPLLLPCWAYWIPMCSLMYSLPANLTFVFASVASAASATVLVAVARR